MKCIMKFFYHLISVWCFIACVIQKQRIFNDHFYNIFFMIPNISESSKRIEDIGEAIQKQTSNGNVEWGYVVPLILDLHKIQHAGTINKGENGMISSESC